MIKVFKNIRKNFCTVFKRTKLKAIHEDDLLSMLDNLGITEKIQKGEYRCEYCNKIISLDNLWCIRKKDNRIQLICSNYDCLNKLQSG